MSNSQPKSIALMFLLGAFLTGGAVVFAADRAMASKEPYARTYSSKGMRAELARDLALTDEQRVVVDSILNWRNARHRELQTPLRPILEANRDSARVLILQHLDSTQQLKFLEMIERLRLQDEQGKTQKAK